MKSGKQGGYQPQPATAGGGSKPALIPAAALANPRTVQAPPGFGGRSEAPLPSKNAPVLDLSSKPGDAVTGSDLFPAKLVSVSLNMLPYASNDGQSSAATVASTDEFLILDVDSVQYDQVDALTFMNNDLATLLQLDYRHFWAQVIHDASVRAFLDTYMSHAPRRLLATTTSAGAEVHRLNSSIRKRVLMVLLRLSLHRDQGAGPLDVNMSKEQHGNILYDHWLFDMPKMMDMCSIYGVSNPDIVKRIVTNVFDSQAKYADDLYNASLVLAQAMDEIAGRFQQKSGKASQTRSELKQVCLFVSDIVTDLLQFADAYPPALRLYQEKDVSLLGRLTNCYDVVVPLILHELDQSRVADVPELQQCRQDILELAHLIFEAVYLKPLSTSSQEHTAREASLHELVTVLQNIPITASGTAIDAKLVKHVDMGAFLRHYNRAFDLDSVLERLRMQSSDSMEATRLEYLITVLRQASSGMVQPQPLQPIQPESAVASGPKFNPGASLATDSALLTSNIRKLRSIFDDFSEDFARDCLKHFENNYERALNAILDMKLPKHLSVVQDRKKYRSSQTGGADQQIDFNDEKATDGEQGFFSGQGDEQFQEFLQRTGRVSRFDAQDRRAGVELNDLDDRDRDIFRNQLANYTGETNDDDDDVDSSYDEFIGFKVDETTEDVEIEDERGVGKRNTTRPSAASDDKENDMDANDMEDKDDLESLGLQKGWNPTGWDPRSGLPRPDMTVDQQGRLWTNNRGRGGRLIRGGGRGGGKARGSQQQGAPPQSSAISERPPSTAAAPPAGGRPKPDLSQRTDESLRARQKKDRNKSKVANHDRKQRAQQKHSRGMGGPPG